MATEQCKRAIAQMLEAGFERSEFSVRTERKWRTSRRSDGSKFRYVEYGDALIYCSAPRSKQYLLLERAIAAGLGGMIVQHPDGSWGYPHFTTDYKSEERLLKVSFYNPPNDAGFIRTIIK